jgi:hypothetical protein
MVVLGMVVLGMVVLGMVVLGMVVLGTVGVPKHYVAANFTFSCNAAAPGSIPAPLTVSSGAAGTMTV